MWIRAEDYPRRGKGTPLGRLSDIIIGCKGFARTNTLAYQSVPKTKNVECHWRQYKDNTFNGLGSYTYANGERHVGSFLGGNFDGFGVVYSANGQLLKKGFWKNDEYVGEEERTE
jgi:hypothetical protein